MTLVIAAALAATVAQDDRVEMKWSAEKGDRFDLKWTFDDTNVRQPGTGPRVDLTDRRTVEAEMEPTEDPNRFLLRLKKVAWNVGHPDYDIQLALQPGKAPAARVRLKVDPKSTAGGSVESQVDHQKARMLQQMEGEYALVFDPSSGTSQITRNNAAGRNTNVFDRAFLHGPVLKGSVTTGQTWKEDLRDVLFPQLVETRTMSFRVDVKGAGVTVKGFLQQPISQLGALDSVSGNYALVREFTFHKDGYLSGSKEESTFTKKVDTKRTDAGAQGFKENNTHTIKQALVIKKRPAPKPKE